MFSSPTNHMKILETLIWEAVTVRCLQIHFPAVRDITDLLIHKWMTILSKFLS